MGSENTQCGSHGVQVLVDVLGDALYLSVQLILDLEEVGLVIFSDEVDGNSEVTESAGSADSMKVNVGVLGEVEVDDHVDSLDVDTSGEDVGAHEASGLSILEVMEHPAAE
jgi:hypothetical protein